MLNFRTTPRGLVTLLFSPSISVVIATCLKALSGLSRVHGPVSRSWFPAFIERSDPELCGVQQQIFSLTPSHSDNSWFLFL